MFDEANDAMTEDELYWESANAHFADEAAMPWDGATVEDAEEVLHDIIAVEASNNPIVQQIVRAALVVIARGGEAAEILRPALSPLMVCETAF